VTCMGHTLSTNCIVPYIIRFGVSPYNLYFVCELVLIHVPMAAINHTSDYSRLMAIHC